MKRDMEPWFAWILLLLLALGAFGSFLYAASRVVSEWPGPRPPRKRLHLVEDEPREELAWDNLGTVAEVEGVGA